MGIKSLLAKIGFGVPASASSSSATFFSPYGNSAVDSMYNLLFCDDIKLFKNDHAREGPGPFSILLKEPPDLDAFLAIATDEENEGRVRALAFNLLRAAGRDVPAKHLLGAIVEVSMSGGLDTLAAFSEGGVRYLNHSGKMLIFEGQGHPAEALARQLITVAQPVVDRIGPWNKPRRSPPQGGNVRMTFLVSDGLYFGEGSLAALQKDPVGGPVLATAAQLLKACVDSARTN